MNRFEKGFTLIELMIVVAIIGILSTLAVATYQTYKVRAQISEGLNMASSFKVPIVDAYTQDGVAPATRVEAGMSANAADTSGDYVVSAAIVDGRIDVTYGGATAHPDIVDKTLSITPYITGGNTVIWRCGLAGEPSGNLLDNGAGHIDPTVASRYLPSACRN